MKAPWLDEVRRASLECLATPAFYRWVMLLRTGVSDPFVVLQRAADELGESLAFAFSGQAHPIRGWSELRRRGWAACVDVAAVLLAVAQVLRVERHTWLALEAPSSMPTYSHARVVVTRPRGVPLVLDPYAAEAAPIRSRIDVLVSAPDVLHLGARAALMPASSTLQAVEVLS